VFCLRRVEAAAQDQVGGMEMYVRVLRREGETLVAACDKEVLGKTFSDGRLEIEVKKDFYCGEIKDIKELPAALSEATMANLSGNNVVDSALKQGYIRLENVLDIGGIKHAQFVII